MLATPTPLALTLRCGRRWLGLVALATALLLGIGGLATPGASAVPRLPHRPGLASAPRHLTTNRLPEPVDVDRLDQVRLGWQLATGDQVAYQVRLGVAGAHRTLWDSHKVTSSDSTHVGYDGPALDPAQRYTWRVRVWTNPSRSRWGRLGLVSRWSDPATFGTGPGQTWADARPIWTASPASDWTDYTLSLKLTVNAVATGVRFRSPDSQNGYMWQFRSSSAGSNESTLVPHTLVDGSYTAMTPVALGTTLSTGSAHDVRIEVSGSTITTYLDGRRIDQRDNSLFSSGGIGFRNGRSESGSFDDVVVTSTTPANAGTVLFSQSFDDGSSDFACGSVHNGVLSVGNSGSCLVSSLDTDWALFRDRVSIPAGRQVAWASLFATGASAEPSRQFVYKAYVDGHFVGLGPTRSIGDETRYDGFDVTRLLRDGRSHVLSAVAHTQSDQRFLAELQVHYTDGSSQTFGTGPSWKARSGGNVWPAAGSIGTSYYSAPQENLDERTYPHGFQTAGYDDSSWSTAAVKDDFDTLVATPTAKVTEQLHAPIRVVDKGDGDYFVDFGRTWIGGAHLTLDGTAGRQVTLRFGEETSAPDTVKYQMRTGNTYEDQVTLRDGPQSVDTWGMRVFRYAEVLNSPQPITAKNLQALALVYPFGSPATFTSSDSDLEQVWTLSRNTLEAVNQNFYTDSWTRERTDYEADAYLQQLANDYLIADPTLGEYSDSYFRNHRTWPTEWPLYVVLAAYDDWQQTGSTAHLESMYDVLKGKLPDQWFSSQTNTINKSYRSDGCSSQTDCDIVDWPSSERDGFVFTPQNTVINALAYRSYADMAQAAEALDHPGDAEDYQAKATAIRSAMNATMYDPATGAFVDGLSADSTPVDHRAVQSSAFAGALGVPDTAAQRSEVAAAVASKGMVCSTYCSGFLLEALYRGEHGQDALDLLTGHGLRSWLTMIDQGAGATGEAWDPSLKPNMTWSHPWSAAPAYVIPRDMYGIETTSPGYATFTVKPQVGDQRYGSVTVPTVRGTIGVAFDRVRDRTDLGVDVPGNSAATVSIPGERSLRPGWVFVDGVPRRGSSRDGRSVVEVGPGCHTLSVRPGGAVRHDPRLTRVCDPS